MCQLVQQNDGQVLEQYKEDTFQYIFWKQQKEAIGKTGAQKCGICWHPLFIKWCLYLGYQSGRAYETLRDTGCIALSSLLKICYSTTLGC